MPYHGFTRKILDEPVWAMRRVWEFNHGKHGKHGNSFVVIAIRRIRKAGNHGTRRIDG